MSSVSSIRINEHSSVLQVKVAWRISERGFRMNKPIGGRVEEWRGWLLSSSRFHSPPVEPDVRISRIRLS